MSVEKVKYLIIGNSAGGIGAAEAIREVDRECPLSIVSGEPYPAYSRPRIADYLAKRCPLEGMLFRPTRFYAENNVRTYLGKKVVSLSLETHTARLAGGEEIGWEQLLLATGGVAIIPPLAGIEKNGVFTFTTLDDAVSIDRSLRSDSSAAVIGGGLIGLSVTEALIRRGIRVTIVEKEECLLSVMLDEIASLREESALRQAGVNVITGHMVTSINGDADRVNSVTLDDASLIPSDLVIIAAGVRSAIELVNGTGIKVGRGITVDRHMQTSWPGVYSCGDVAEAFDFITNDTAVTPVWPNAYLGGRVAGLNMAGVATEYPGGTLVNSLKYFGVDILSAGIVNPPDSSYEVLSGEHGDCLCR